MVIDKAEDFIKAWLKKKYPGAKYTSTWISSEVVEVMDEYAQQVSRDTAYLFWGWVHKTKSHDQRLRYSFDELWNQWKLNQNQQ